MNVFKRLLAVLPILTVLAFLPSSLSAQGGCWDCDLLFVMCVECGDPGGLGMQCFDSCDETHQPDLDKCKLYGAHCEENGYFAPDITMDGTVLGVEMLQLQWGDGQAAVSAAPLHKHGCNGLVVIRGYGDDQKTELRAQTAALKV